VNRKALLYDSGVLLTGKRLSGGDSAKGDLKGRNRQDKTALHVKRSSEVAFVAVFLASEKAWAVSGELVSASGGAGRSEYY